MERAVFVPLSEIIPDDMFRVRAKEQKAKIDEYAQLFREYKESLESDEPLSYPFGPISYWIGDGRKVLHKGFHRYFAAVQAGLEEILAVEEEEHDKVDALKRAIEDNRKHGLPYEYGDYKVAIRKILAIQPDIKLREIEKLTGASHAHTSTIRKQILEEKEKVTCDPLTNAGRNEDVATTKGTRKNLPLVYWGRLKSLSVDEQIGTLVNTIDEFANDLSEKEQRQFRKKLSAWLSKKEKPTGKD